MKNKGGNSLCKKQLKRNKYIFFKKSVQTIDTEIKASKRKNHFLYSKSTENQHYLLKEFKIMILF